MKMVLKGGLILVAVFALLLGASALWLWSTTQMASDLPASTAEPRGDTLLDEFYTVPSELPAEAGFLIKQEELVGESVLEEAAQNTRLLYSSTDGLDGQSTNAVSAALYFPEGEAPEGGWPLLVWSHGTVGIGDLCAPSYAGRTERDRTYLGPWLEAGYAIAASDYQGLGTPGTHPYMDARTMAYNNLDLMRALAASDLPLSSKVVIAGQSQGATGAIATASYAGDYAPNVDLAGVMATGVPYFSPEVLWSLIGESDRDEVSTSTPFTLYMLAFAEMLDPDFDLDEVITDKAKPIADTVGEACVFDFITASTEAGLSQNNSFNTSVEIPLMKVLSRANLYEIGFETPLFTGSGTQDKITPFPMQQAFLKDACEAGMTINANTYDGANHNEGLLQSSEAARDFAATVLAGGEVLNTCES